MCDFPTGIIDAITSNGKNVIYGSMITNYLGPAACLVPPNIDRVGGEIFIEN